MAQHLAGTYADDAVEALADEDGRAQVFTATWGKGNREPRVIHAVHRGAAVSSALISHDLYGSLPAIEEELEELAAKAPRAQDMALAAIAQVEVAEATVADLQQACREGELALPEHHWRHRLAEFLVLGLLGFGDLIFTSTAFEVFGLSDQHLGFLPFNELQLAASSTVVALLLCTRLAGHKFRLIGLLVEEARSDSLVAEVNRVRARRLRVRTWFTVGAAIVAVLGVFAILVGLSEVRASYLLQSGIDAHQWQFMFIQAGIAAAGFALSAWMAHPYDREHHSASQHWGRTNTEMQAGPNQLFRQSSVICKKAGISAAFARLVRRTSPQPMDVLTALRVLQGHLAGLSKGPIDVVLMSSMLNAVAPLRLNDPETLAQGSAKLIGAVEQAGLMPKCAGWNVYVVGGGDTLAGGVTGTVSFELEAFWSALFARCGGRLVYYDTQLAEFPVDGAIGPLTTNPLPEHRKTVDDRTQVSITLPDSVLFASGSSTLASAADEIMIRLLSIVTTQHPLGSIEVTGYTDSVPDVAPGGNRALSQERADAVRAWLLRHSVPARRLRAIGEGSAHPIGDKHRERTFREQTCRGRHHPSGRIVVTIQDSPSLQASARKIAATALVVAIALFLAVRLIEAVAAVLMIIAAIGASAYVVVLIARHRRSRW